MATPDLDVIKEIPGYKVILKAVLKSQIQQLVELLAVSTDEESVFLTASVSDGTLSHLGSDSGKGFLEGHEDIKSQFLGFCLKNHHRKAQEKKVREVEVAREAEAARQAASIQSRFSSRPPYMVNRPMRPSMHAFPSPRQQFRTPGMRHEPYPASRPFRSRGPRNFNPRTATPPRVGSPARTVTPPQTSASLTVPSNNKVIKIEPDSGDEGSNLSAEDTVVTSTPNGGDTASVDSNLPSSNPAASSEQSDMKSEQESKSSEHGDETDTESLPPSDENLNFSDTAPAEGLSLDSDLSNLISSAAKDGLDGSDSNSAQGNNNAADGNVNQTLSDPNTNIKVEAVSEAEMELEITGVELGRYGSGAADDSWAPGSEQDTSGYASAGMQGDLSQQGYDEMAHTIFIQGGTEESGEILPRFRNYRTNSPPINCHQTSHHSYTGISARVGSSSELESNINRSPFMYNYDGQYSIVNTEAQNAANFSADELMRKKPIRGKASSAQYCFQVLLRDAAKFANDLWERAPTLSQISKEEQAAFFDAMFSVAPQLTPRRRDIWSRLGDCLQNRRKYMSDRRSGKR